MLRGTALSRKRTKKMVDRGMGAGLESQSVGCVNVGPTERQGCRKKLPRPKRKQALARA
jgi:hypothetical protein